MSKINAKRKFILSLKIEIKYHINIVIILATVYISSIKKGYFLHLFSPQCSNKERYDDKDCSKHCRAPSAVEQNMFVETEAVAVVVNSRYLSRRGGNTGSAGCYGGHCVRHLHCPCQLQAGYSLLYEHHSKTISNFVSQGHQPIHQGRGRSVFPNQICCQP